MNTIWIVSGVLSIISGTISAQRVSPCPHILKYEEQKEKDRWTSVLEIINHEGFDGIWLNIALDSKADVLLNTFGESTTSNNQNFEIHRPDYRVLPGGIVRIRLTIKYNPEKPVPNIVSVRLNGIEICNEKINKVITKTTEQPDVTDPQIDGRIGNEICGTTNQARPLVYNGQISDKGRWPWHIAIMKLKNNKFDYHCGGSLISDSYVLTAAHCVTILSTEKLIDKDMFVLYLGLNQLTEPGPYFKLRLVSDIKIHDEYNPARYFNDVAVIKLSEPVIFNDFIRPVCLWDDEETIRELIGQYGTVVGWGIDNNNKTTPNLMEAKLPIVGLETCLYHDRSFFSQFTSLKTYCAGGQNDTNVCSGDSGGGMVFPKPGSTGDDIIWRIRGLVSVSPKLAAGTVCNTKSYAVFTDIAQHLTWIKKAANMI